MIELVATRPTPTTFAVAVGAAMLTFQIQYPPRADSYEVQQVRGTHSDFMHNLVLAGNVGHFAQEVSELYHAFAERQERLGDEFDAAIFSDLESLYEA